MGQADAAYLLLVEDTDWVSGSPIRIPRSLADQLAPGLGASILIAASRRDQAPSAIAVARIFSISESPDAEGVELTLRSLRLMREPWPLEDLTPLPDGKVSIDGLDRMIADEAAIGDFEERPQPEIEGVEDALFLEALAANGWQCQLTGWQIPSTAPPGDHVVLIARSPSTARCDRTIC